MNVGDLCSRCKGYASKSAEDVNRQSQVQLAGWARAVFRYRGLPAEGWLYSLYGEAGASVASNPVLRRYGCWGSKLQAAKLRCQSTCAVEGYPLSSYDRDVCLEVATLGPGACNNAPFLSS